MLNKKKLLFAIFLSINLINGCSTPQNTNLSKITNLEKTSQNIVINGEVQFPDFKIKATLSEIAPKATVSLIYPSDYPVQSLRNVSVASGLTNASGQFSLNIQNGFTPETGTVYVLEAIKRIGGAGNNSLALRTQLKWSGTSFESITNNVIYINTKTTALSIISSLGEISSSDTINKMPINNGSIQVTDINDSVTAGKINLVKTLVEESLVNNNDPVASIVLNNGVYSLKEVGSINLPPTLGCIGEPDTCTTPEPVPSADGCLGEPESCSNPTPTPIPTDLPTPTPSSDPTPTPDPTSIPFVGEYKVNSTVLENQQKPKTAFSNNGFVVIWESNLQDGSGYGLFGQRYDINGVKLGSEFQINTFTVNDQINASVSSDSSGNFIVVWQSPQDGSGNGIYAQRYTSNGQTLGSEIKINTYTTGEQSYPSVSMNDYGESIIVWQSAQDGSGYGIYSQRFNSNGQMIGSETKINTTVTGNQMYPSVDLSNNGKAVVVWQSTDDNLSGVYGHLLDPNGQPLSGEDFQINTYTTDNQDTPVVSSDSSGNFVVIWRSKLQDSNGLGIYGQRFDNTANKIGAEFQVNTYIIGDQTSPRVSMNNSGNFTVVWQSPQDGSGTGIYEQRYDSSGSLLGTEMKVNTYTNSNQIAPDVFMNNNGDTNIVWESNLQDSSLYGIYGQRFDNLGNKK